MHRILFICYGNICRSPMAEYIMKDLVSRQGWEDDFHIESRATSTEELGNPVYPPARQELALHDISCDGKVSVQLQREDYANFDLLLGMDTLNMKTIPRITGGDPAAKIYRITEHCGGADVADPWYTRRFDTAYKDILQGCESWLRVLIKAEI